jgi:hypothetical protein
MHTISPRSSDVTRPLRALPAASPSNAGPVDVVAPSVGLRLPRQLPFDSWLRIGSHLSAVASSSAWCLGDWLIYGEVAYEGRYRNAIEQTSLDYQTLRNYAWVARSFPMARRRDGLSFGHHAEIAALPEAEQDYWLRKAEELSWSRNKLRGEVRASLKEREKGLSVCPESDEREQRPAQARAQVAVADLTIKVTPAQLEACESAATRAGLSVDAWAALALEAAAHGILERRAG